MPVIQNLKPFLRKLEKFERESKRKNNGNVVVGYAASYAIHVHENMQAKHGSAYNEANPSKKGKARGPNQQAKFLEQPFREHRNEISFAIIQAYKSGMSLVKALLIGGHLLQRLSQELVPVDMGNLEASAYTELE